MGRPKVAIAIAFTGNPIGYDCDQPILEYGRRKATIGLWLDYLEHKLGPLVVHHRDYAGADAAFHKQCGARGIPRVIFQHHDQREGRAMIHTNDWNDKLDKLVPAGNEWITTMPNVAEAKLIASSRILIAAPRDVVEPKVALVAKTVAKAREAKLWIIKVYADGTWDDEGPRPSGLGDIDTGHDFGRLGDQCSRCNFDGLARYVFDGEPMPFCEPLIAEGID